MSPLLELRGVAARYGRICALSDVTLEVGRSEAVALLGANGAGKSTLIRTVIGLVDAVAGRIVFDGLPLRGLGVERRVRSGLGYCPEGRRVFPGMSVRENLEVAFFGGARARAARVAEICELFPVLAARASTPAWQLSGGQQQMLAIGRAVMHRPRLLLLDEPSLGLAPRLVTEVLGMVRALVAAGTSVLLAEQNVARALEVCERAYVLELGRVAASGPAAELRDDARVVAAFLGGGASG